MFLSSLPLLQDLAPEGPVVALETLATPLAVAAGLALVVERVLELLKNATDLFPGRAGGAAARPASALAEPIEALERFHAAEARVADAERRQAELIARTESAGATGSEAVEDAVELAELRKLAAPSPELRELEVDEMYPPELLVVEPATDADDGSALRALTIQLFAVSFGIMAARLFQVQLFEALTVSPLPGGPPMDYLLTGLLIGGGSGPVHMLIRFIGERKVKLPEDPDRDEDVTVVARPLTVAERNLLPPSEPTPWEPQAAPSGGEPATTAGKGVAVEAAPDTAWIEIPYRGGVDRERLESVHRRPKDPDTIIYHHTAMHRSSTFEDVVRVIKDRRDSRGNPWITGYNCVVTGDGVVHPFCRWDRYGNHAAGWNARSLGIALNGNFETDASVPFSNPDGRYGPARPSLDQLRAAARTVALWALIYDIELDFERRIIPHRNVSPKTCPGNEFPYDDFEALVRRFHAAWSAGPDRGHVEAFDRLPYLHV